MIDTTCQRLNISNYGIYFFILVPITLFLISLLVPPAIVFDVADSFIALRSMLHGGAFNYIPSPDPADIARDTFEYLTWWSPGQYLAPGAFIWAGAREGLAISLVSLICSIAGVIGWIQVAKSYQVSNFVLSLFVLGLVTFHYAVWPFRFYSSEVLLFAVAPWSLLALIWATRCRSITSFAIAFAVTGLLFLAKLSGLVILFANTAAISCLDLVEKRRLSAALFGMWIGVGFASALIFVLWVSRGQTPISLAAIGINFSVFFFPFAATAFSGFYLYDLVSWLLLNPGAPILSNIQQTSYLLGPLGVLLIGWSWARLRNTAYRQLSVTTFSIIAFYVVIFVAIYIRKANANMALPFEERYFRYSGILFFLVILVALDAPQKRRAKIVASLAVVAFSVYGLISYANGILRVARGDHYDPVSGISLVQVSPKALEYIRSEQAIHNWKNAIVVVPDPEVVGGLPDFRIIFSFLLIDSAPLAEIGNQKFFGRVEKLFVIMNDQMIGSPKAEAILRAFRNYEFERWSVTKEGGTVIYSQ